MRAEKALARLTAGTVTDFTRIGGGYGVDKNDALLAMQGLPRLQSNILWAKWMGDEDARKAAEREILLTIIDWPLYDEKSRTGELRRNAGILRAMAHVAMAEVLSSGKCWKCKGTGMQRSDAKNCKACDGYGEARIPNTQQARIAKEYLEGVTHKSWPRIARDWKYETVLEFVQDKASHGIAYMQKRLSAAA